MCIRRLHYAADRDQGQAFLAMAKARRLAMDGRMPSFGSRLQRDESRRWLLFHHDTLENRFFHENFRIVRGDPFGKVFRRI
ncbi:MAG TPA: hypothetical protein VHV55_26155, partial [Pirellulales bacterium]|nr:hypothetical protein [Pirellulales bacterium]